MSKKIKKNKKDIGDHWKQPGPFDDMDKATKLMIDKSIERFAASQSEQFTFSPALSNKDRAYIHRQAAKIGWKSASHGVDAERCITIRKPKEDNLCSEKLQIKEKSLEYYKDLLRQNPELNFILEDNKVILSTHSGQKLKGIGVERLGYGPPKVPKAKSKNADSYATYRQTLPTWKHKKEICNCIKNNLVTFVKGDTGCGKTTQVAQYILDEAQMEQRPVRIICTVPRRLAAISISERVAVERGEALGSTVGYQIRLEKRLSLTETLLTYCTAGILLRSITSPESTLLDNLTHIIIDEVHERDRYTDFLMSCLKIMMQNHKNLRLVLMGADLNVDLFTNYFGGTYRCPVIHVQGRTHPVETLFLEDVLDFIDSDTNDNVRSSGAVRRKSSRTVNHRTTNSNVTKRNSEIDWEEFIVNHESVLVNVNYLIENVFKSGDQDSFDTFIDLVMKEAISINSMHSDPASDVTMLMAVAACGDFSRVNTLLELGANACIRSSGTYEFTAKEWAEQYGHDIIARLLDSNEKDFGNSKKTEKLNKYLKDLDTEKVDLLLAYRIIQKIHNNEDKRQSILVFLPGYEEIVTLQAIIKEDETDGFNDYAFEIHMLHSNIHTGDQKTVFDRPRQGTRKIILSTNIAETSLTIEDIVHVIDSGKVKEKSYDVISGITQLKSVWISKASSNQRKGRAGRCQSGICYRLYSTDQYDTMEEFPTPEIIRTNLHELCLSSRSFLEPDYSIEYFFSLIPQPPAPIAVKTAVQELMSMGALNKNEYLTDLGIHLVDFPVEPRLGKALVYSIVFKCLNPIVTIVAALSHKDPFQLPSQPELKAQAYEIKRQYSEDCFSDHKALLSLYKEWDAEKQRGKRNEVDFCKRNFVSASSLKMISGIRSQLLSQVRASGFIKNSIDFNEVNINENNWTVVKAVLTAMLYPSLCCVRPKKQCLFNSNGKKITFHKSTTAHSKKDNWTTDIPFKFVLYDEMTKTGPMTSIRGCTMVSTAMVSILAGNFISPDIDLEQQLMKIDDWLTITVAEEVLSVILTFRKCLDVLVVEKLKDPGHKFTSNENAVITTVIKILDEEESSIEPRKSKLAPGVRNNERSAVLVRSILRHLPALVHSSGNRSILSRRSLQ